MVRNVSRRLERPEERAAIASKVWSHSTRILLVHPQKGCTGVLVLETGKPTMHLDPTPEDVEWVRADLEQRRIAARMPTEHQRLRQPGSSTSLPVVGY